MRRLSLERRVVVAMFYMLAWWPLVFAVKDLIDWRLLPDDWRMAVGMGVAFVTAAVGGALSVLSKGRLAAWLLLFGCFATALAAGHFAIRYPADPQKVIIVAIGLGSFLAGAMIASACGNPHEATAA